MARHFDYDENKLLPLQREAAAALVEHEFTPTKERKTKQQIADEIGISRMTLYRWDKSDANFIAYKNSLASNYVDSSLSMVYKKLLESIENGSVRGIETYLKRIGDLDKRSEVTITDGGDDKSFDERKRELLERMSDEGDI